MHILECRYAVVLSAVGLGVFAGGVADRAMAADAEWINPTPPTGPFPFLIYGTGSNWDTGVAPTLADDALFQIDLLGNPIVLSAGSQSNNLTVADNAWIFSGITGGDLTTGGVALIDDVSATSLATGASLNITDNAQWDIADATLTNDNDLLVGQQGFGTLGIQTGSAVTAENIFVGGSAGSFGLVTIDGAASTLTAVRTDSQGRIITIGDLGGTGTVTLTNGGQLLTTNTGASANQDIVIGRSFFDADLADPGNPLVRSNGTLTVSGSGSLAETSDLLVGHLGGIGTLNVLDGGQVQLIDGSSPEAIFGLGAGSIGDGLVSGTGSVLRAHSVFAGRDGGTGGLAIANGAELRTEITAQGTATREGETYLGWDNASTGEVADGMLAVYGEEAGNTATFNNAAGLFVGVEGRGELRIGRDLDGNSVGSGVVNTASLVVGDAAGNNLDNRVIVDGADALLNVTNSLDVGFNGTGTLDVLDGTIEVGGNLNVGVGVDGTGALNASGATINITGNITAGLQIDSVGTIDLDNGTTLIANGLFFGNSGGTDTSPAVGTLTIQGGSTVTLNNTANGVVTLGDDPGTTGIVTVTGAGSSLTGTNGVGEWWIGGSSNDDGGTGTLNILDGATVASGGRMVLGYDSTGANIARGTLNIDGAGSTLNAGNDLLIVGFQGSGEADITAGGSLNANAIFIADEAGSAGSDLTIDGPGSSLSLQQRLHVGDSARGSMTISGGAQVDVALDQGASSVNQRLIVGVGGSADGSSLTITGPGSRLDYHSDGENVRIGFNGGSTTNRAVVRVEDGGVLSAVQRNPDNSIATQASIILGDESGGHGELIVNGAGSLVEGSTLDLGQGTNASGIVAVQDSGRLALTGNIEVGDVGTSVFTNVMSVTGANSRVEAGTEFTIGAQGGVRGSLIVEDGGTVTNGTDAFVGLSNGTTASAKVGDTGSTLDARWDVGGDLYIAGNRDLGSTGSFTSGSGTLTLEDNGTVQVAGFAVLKDRGTLNLNGGTFIADNLIFQNVAAGSDADFNFNAGTLRYTESKNFSVSDISTIFSGGPALLDAGKHLAFDGVAVLAGPIEIDGGSLSLGSIGASSFAQVEFDAGTLNFTGSSPVVTNSGIFGSTLVIDEDETINVTNTLFVQADGLLNIAEGNFSSGAMVNSGTIVIAQGTADFGSLNNTNGDLVLVDAITTGTITGGDITIVNTNAASALTLTSGSSIAFGIETAAGADDLLQVDNTATLAGSLVVSAADVSGVGLGDEFDLILANAVSGTFDNIALPTLGSGLEFDVLYEASRVALSVIAVNLLAGDYNGNGVVDAADYTVWADNFGSMAALAADGNGNGTVDAADYTIWADNFGTSAAASQGLTLIPEPGTFALVVPGFLWALKRRSRAV